MAQTPVGAQTKLALVYVASDVSSFQLGITDTMSYPVQGEDDVSAEKRNSWLTGCFLGCSF